MLTEREKYMALVDNDPLKKADAIVLLTGDGLFRVPEAAKLFKEQWAPVIVVSGNMNNPESGGLPGAELKKELVSAGIPEAVIMMEDESLHTRDQAVRVIRMADQSKWHRILMVASAYHQYRAFLTFLKARAEAGSALEITNAPARGLSWTEENPWGRRIDLLDAEFKKIEEYRALGHVATFAEGIEYLLK